MDKILELINQSRHYDLSQIEINWNIVYVILGVIFINYIIAIIKAKNKTIIAITGPLDLFLVATPIIGIFVAIITIIIHDNIYPENSDNFQNMTIFYYLIISTFAIITTFVVSVLSNRNNILNIFISFLAKLFVMLISFLLIFAIFGGSNSKKDGRTKDGTSGNSHTVWKLALVAIAGYTIFVLVSKRRYSDIAYEKIHNESERLQKEVDNLNI